MFSKIDLILIGRAGGFKILGSQNKTEIKAEFANLFSAPPTHCSRLHLPGVSRKEGVGGGTSNLVDIGNVAWFESCLNKFREEKNKK